MAGEKQSSISLTIAKTGQVFALTPPALTEDLAGTQAISNVQNVGTGWEAILIGDLSRIDLLAVRNADNTNFIQLATANDGSGIFAKLTPGRFAFVPVDSGATVYAKADTAACDLQVVAVEP